MNALFVTNVSGKEEPLELPTMDFSDRFAKRKADQPKFERPGTPVGDGEEKPLGLPKWGGGYDND